MRTGLIVCGALGRDVRQVVRERGWDAKVIGVPPVDHLYPLRIAQDVENRILKLRDQVDQIVVVFGECGTRGTLDEVLQRHGILRVPVENCYEMYAGDLYHRLREEEIGTYFLTDFLVSTFHKAVVQGLGLDRYPELKQEYFHNCTRIAYLMQQEDNALLRRQAESIAEFMGLPITFHYTGRDRVEEHIRQIITMAEYKKGLPSYKLTCSGRDLLDDLMSFHSSGGENDQ